MKWIRLLLARSVRWIAWPLGVISVWLSALLIRDVDGLNQFSGSMSDQILSNSRPIVARSDIALVVVNKGTAKALDLPAIQTYVSKTQYASLLQTLGNAGAAVVVTDITFDESRDPTKSGDKALVAALKSCPSTRFVFPKDYHGDKNPVEDESQPGGFLYDFQEVPFLKEPLPNTFTGHTMAYAPNGFGIGIFPILKDITNYKPLYHVGLVASLLFKRGSLSDLGPADESLKFYSDLGEWPLGDAGEVPVLWPKAFDDFGTTSVQETLTMSQDSARRAFQNKLVIIGDATGTEDLINTIRFGLIPGVFFLANSINTQLTTPNLWPQRVPEVTSFWAAFVLASFAGFAILNLKSWLRIAIPLALLTLAFLSPMILAKGFNLLAPALDSLLAVAIASSVASAVVLAISGPLQRNVSGEHVFTTVLFVDIVDSTPLTLKLGGKGYQAFYTRLMRKCAKEVESIGGQIERTTGDGFIATFVSEQPHVAAQNCLKVTSKIHNLSKDASLEAGAKIEMKCGFESGPVSGGFVIEAARRVWSSAGPVVNMAQRLLSVADSSGEPTVIGPTAAKLIHEDKPTRSLGQFELKGFDEVVEAFALAEKDQP